ncbi:riboflavin synthase subunit alpha [Neisseriaceae bacterium PsAf]|nr:riboflavin synthase subunit alpha [Neisseriaceae bacterium PsAf]MCV2503642.1 riboflavin synthase subunit alpha [Neisseriaceae bacterium]
MFTGIVQGTGTIVDIQTGKDNKSQKNWVKLPKASINDLQIGASVSNNGCCLTITEIKDDIVAFNLIEETLKRTNLSFFKVGDEINIERSMKVGDEIGGHVMSGHIMCTLTISKIEKDAENCSLFFNIPKEIKPYIFEKGFVGLDGCSLTVGKIDNNEFSVHLIPETLNLTIFKHRQIGDKINLEIDPQTQAIVNTVARVMHDQFILPL